MSLPRIMTLLLLFCCIRVSNADAEQIAIIVGITPAIVHDQYEVMANLRTYLEKKLRRPVKFISRDSYRETIDLLKDKKMDFAWVSDYPYVYLKQHRFAKMLVMPTFHGRPYYRSYLIVPNSDHQTDSLRDLKGKIFAYADPYSNSGFLVPRYQIRKMNEDPNHFFRKTFFTWAHKKIIDAVGQGLADGGCVDSFVWDTLSIIRPDITRRTRIVARSPEYGFPPIVAQYAISDEDYAAMQHVLLEMSKDAEGERLLEKLNIDGFVLPDPKLYADVEKMMNDMGEE